MVAISKLTEGDEITNGDETKVVVGFIKNFSGEKDIAKLGWESDDGTTGVSSVGKAELGKDEADQWELVE